MRPVPLDAVTMHDGFWRSRIETNRVVALPQIHDRLREHGVVENFRDRSHRRGLWFTDSDLYKWLEAASYSLQSHADPELEASVEAVIDAVIGAQEPDGYLNTNFAGATRFRDLSWSHELYCAGHLMQAAVAHRRATGSDRLLGAATRFADLLVETLGGNASTERDRHPVVEMALVELARATNDDRYRVLAGSLCDRVPHDDWDRLWGHAVCALYFACGCADLALDGDSKRTEPLQRWWADLVGRSSYVTGGVGGRWVAESMGRPYELPHEGAYAESCAAVAATQWSWRMLQLTGDATIADYMELVLHNAVAASVSLAGDEWFYANPLASSEADEQHPFIGDDLPITIAGPMPLRRRGWRDVTCCPPNVARLLASVAGYAYFERPDELRIALYMPSRVATERFDVEVVTGMPWSGEVSITVRRAPEHEATIALRIPGWSRAPDAGTWRELRRQWRPGDTVEIDLGLGIDLLAGDPRVAECRGAIAVRRGPLVYCAEGVDHAGVDLREVAIRRDTELRAEWEPHVLGGVVMLRGAGQVRSWSGELYQPVTRTARSVREIELVLVPYAVWANRARGPMTVWLQADTG